MKKCIYALVLAGLMLLSASCSDRSSILKVYNWADYIDETVLDDFEVWYQEQTGEAITVVYQTFDINETMLSRIEKGQEDYDVVCPSEYIIERMMAQNLLLPIQRDFGSTPNYIDQNLSPFIVKSFEKVNCGDKRALDYTVPYMWGTTGILYNAKYVSDEEASSWDILVNPKFYDKLFVKDACRDVYTTLLLYLKNDEIKAGLLDKDSIMYHYNEEYMLLVENFLKMVAPGVAGWEADFGKEQMTQEKGYVNLSWSGDAKWAYDEAKTLGVDLRYRIPQEGANVWFDGWVIPKYAKNTKAASYFINFLCRSDIAIRNMDATGYVGVLASPEILEAMTDESQDYTVNASYFFGPGMADNVKLNHMFYPDSVDISRCTLMHDWGEDTPRLIEMWTRVKGDNASGRTYALVIILLLAMVGLPIFNKIKKKNRKKSRRRKRRR